MPDGFNWALWQGPEPDRPYHPAYTFSVYRGWYAYGTGCLGDMGHYSLWQPYRILELGVPEWVEARPSNDACVSDDRVSRGGHVSQVAFPKSSSVRWRHPATPRRPAVDTFWYDGGMKPQTPEALIEDGEDLAAEGMLIVGDAGAILCDFRANAPRLIPKQRQQAFEGSVPVPTFDATSPDDEWVGAIKRGGKSQGQLRGGGAAGGSGGDGRASRLRVPYKRLLWDAREARFTNSEEANRLLRRPRGARAGTRWSARYKPGRQRECRDGRPRCRDAEQGRHGVGSLHMRAHVFQPCDSHVDQRERRPDEAEGHRMSLGQCAPMRTRAQPPSSIATQAAMHTANPALRCRVRHA